MKSTAILSIRLEELIREGLVALVESDDLKITSPYYLVCRQLARKIIDNNFLEEVQREMIVSTRLEE